MLCVFVFRWHGSIVARLSYLDVLSAGSKNKGVRHSGVRSRWSEAISAPWLTSPFENQAG